MHGLPKVCVHSTLSMKVVLICVHIWFVDLSLVKDKAPGRKKIPPSLPWKREEHFGASAQVCASR